MPITRTILVLDQVTGSARTDDDEILGYDLDPDARSWIDRERAAGRPTLVQLPGDGDPALFARSLGAELDDPATAPADGATAFVSADRTARGRARAAGMLPVAHPALLPLLADGQDLVGVRLTGASQELLRLAAAKSWVPLRFQPTTDGRWTMLAIGGSSAVADAAAQLISVIPLAYDPAVDDLVILRIDPTTADAAAGLRGRRVLSADGGEVVLALGPDEDGTDLPMHGGHGHTELLTPDPGLLRPARTEAVAVMVDALLGDENDPPSAILEKVVLDPAVAKRILAGRLRCATVTKGYGERLDRYTGVTALNAAGPVLSRHIAHPDNARVEEQLLTDLRAMGYCPWRHQFQFGGRTLSNIVADLPGQGRFRLRPEILKRLRTLLTGSGDLRSALATDPQLRALVDAAALDEAGPEDLPDPLLRRELERIVALEPWNPWWKLRCPPSGWGAGVIVVGAHLDSTAGFDPGYRPGIDPAPGRDDNGSGLAAVLTLANHFRRHAGSLTHTVRFCFFNAEEAGLVGSKAYAAQLKAQGAPVRGVYCVDMMGYNSDTTRIFEIHAGYPDPAVRDLSVPLADRVAAAAAATGALLPAQLYTGTNNGGGSDRTVFDGAINRSDHAAFQQQGWGGVLISEDFFVNLAAEPSADANPNYHRSTDASVDVDYAAAITCAIGRAVTLHAL